MSFYVDLPAAIGKNVVLPGLSYGANYVTKNAAPVVGGAIDVVTNPNTLKTAGNFLQETLGAMSRGGKELVKQAIPPVLTGGAALGTFIGGHGNLKSTRPEPQQPPKAGEAGYVDPSRLTPAQIRESEDRRLEIELLRNQLGQLQEISRQQLENQTDLNRATYDPGLIAQRQDIFTQAKIAEAEALQRGAMEKMEEKTRRDVELGTITAWQGITQAEINKDTALGLGMMSIAYSTGIPQPALMQSAANIVQQGRASYGTPTSVL